MNGAVERFDENARRAAGAHGRTLVHPGELLRHPIYTRVVHWASAAFFVFALLSGFAIYTPWMFHALTPLLGGGATRCCSIRGSVWASASRSRSRFSTGSRR